MRAPLAFVVAVFAALALLPLATGGYAIDLVTKIMVYAIFALSLERLVDGAGLVCSGDEATEGLAPLIVAEIWRVIGQIRASGIATLIVDRDYRKVLAHSDRALVLQKGLAVLAGASDAVAGDAALAGYLGV